MLKACTNLSKKALQIASLGLVASSMTLKIQGPLADTLNFITHLLQALLYSLMHQKKQVCPHRNP